MDSANPAISRLHQAYNTAMGLDLPMTACYERWYFEALKLGLTVEHVEICVASRLKFNREHPGHKKGLELKHLIRSEDDVAVVLNEVAVVLAQRRIKVMDSGKASVLRATGRSDAPPQDEAKLVADSKLIQDLRKAAQ